MIRTYQQPEYTGLDVIRKLIKSTDKRGEPYALDLKRPSSTRMVFNSDGYGEGGKCRVVTLVIDHDSCGKLSAFVQGKMLWYKLIGFDDPTSAYATITDLYTNPYYHGVSIYSARLERIKSLFRPLACRDINDLRSEINRFHVEVAELHEVIMRGTNTFGCSYRFNLIKHICYPMFNIYNSVFTNDVWCYSHTTQTKRDKSLKPDNVLHYVERSFKHTDFSYNLDSMFGLDMMTTDHFELYLVNKLSAYPYDSFGVVPNPELKPLIVCIVRVMQLSKVIGGVEAEHLLYIISDKLSGTMTLDQLRNTFITSYLSICKRIGRNVSNVSLSDMAIF